MRRWMRGAGALGTALAVLMVGVMAEAIYFAPDLVHIPAERLVQNLERELAARTPGSDEARWTALALARLHAAAYASGNAPLSVQNPLFPVKMEDVQYKDAQPTREFLLELVVYPGLRNFTATGLRAINPDALKRHGCELEKIDWLARPTGKMVVSFKLPAATGDPWLQELKVEENQSGDAMMGRCLLSALDARTHALPPGAGPVTLTVLLDPVEGDIRPFYGHGDSHVPHVVRPAPDEATRKRGREHLERAQALYSQLIKVKPDDALAHVGLGWVQLELGEKDKARQTLRRAFELAWAVEKDRRSLGLGELPLVVETFGYLKPLLDPVKDADEIARLNQARLTLERLPRPVTPVVIPLEDGLSLSQAVDPEARVPFDLDGSGQPRAWGWVTPRAGWLVYDGTGQGRVTSGLQLFGSVSFWSFWPDGYSAMAALDDDGDGLLRGAELAGLAIWRDANADGVSDPGEVRPVGAWGVVALRVDALRADGQEPFHPEGVVLQGGRTRPTWDWSPVGYPLPGSDNALRGR